MKKLIKIVEIILEAILLIAFIAALGYVTVMIFAVEEKPTQALFAIMAIVLSGLVFAWFKELIKSIKK